VVLPNLTRFAGSFFALATKMMLASRGGVGYANPVRLIKGMTMPFDDNTILSYREETPLDRRRQLIAALRDLPKEFEWNFAVARGEAECGSQGCALGLASILWPDRVDAEKPRFSAVGSQIGLSQEATYHIMSFEGRFARYDRYKVTAAMVADALEETLDAI
jgi:hypothetical protein